MFETEKGSIFITMMKDGNFMIYNTWDTKNVLIAPAYPVAKFIENLYKSSVVKYGNITINNKEDNENV